MLGLLLQVLHLGLGDFAGFGNLFVAETGQRARNGLDIVLQLGDLVLELLLLGAAARSGRLATRCCGGREIGCGCHERRSLMIN